MNFGASARRPSGSSSSRSIKSLVDNDGLTKSNLRQLYSIHLKTHTLHRAYSQYIITVIYISLSSFSPKKSLVFFSIISVFLRNYVFMFEEEAPLSGDATAWPVAVAAFVFVAVAMLAAVVEVEGVAAAVVGVLDFAVADIVVVAAGADADV